MESLFKKNTIKEALLLFPAILTISSTFATSEFLYDGILIAKETLFLYAVTTWTLILFILCLVEKTKHQIPFNTSDIIIITLLAWIIYTYDDKQNIAPQKMRLILQLTILWFTGRYTCANYPTLRTALITILILTATIEAIRGLMQLYNFTGTFNPNFRITGSFFNPGPFAGYLATILPLLVERTLQQYKQNNPLKLYTNLAALTIIIAAILPSLSRSAWLASAISTITLLTIYRTDININIRITPIKTTLFILLGAILLISVYYIKQDSANGRLFMWQRSLDIITQNPLQGVGVGGFPEAFDAAQSKYFATGNATDDQIRIAGNPDYAFNEYLQITIETGIPGLILLLTLQLLALYTCIKQKQYGIAAAILSLTTFSTFTYSLQLIPFAILLTTLLFLATPPNKENKKNKKIQTITFTAILLITSATISYNYRKIPQYYEQWEQIRRSYRIRDYEKVIETYGKLIHKFHTEPHFVFEYAHSLSKEGQYAEANFWLKHTAKLKCDPMIYNIMGQNYQDAAAYHEAEACFLHASHLLPGRIYPYYLLTKLYAHPDFYNYEKMQTMANKVLYTQPKIMSTAIREMRGEIRILLKQTPKQNTP